MAYGTINADVIGTSVAGSNLGAGNASIMKNRIINGSMTVDQRNAGASVTPNGGYTLDRWAAGNSQASKFSVQQNAGSVTPPAGFTYYLGVTSLSAYTVGAAEQFFMYQPIEGYNVADLGWGTANAKTITLSFWVRSSLTGTFGGSILNSAQNRSYPFSYTISAANTWEQKSVTIAGDTSGTWLTTNGIGMYISIGLGVGATNSGTAGAWAGTTYYSATGATSVVGTNGATFYITGVQLEVGSSATGFEYRSYGQELALCQRYYYKKGPVSGGDGRYGIGFGAVGTSTTAYIDFPLPVTMRAAPSSVDWTSGLTIWAGGTNFSVSNIAVYTSGSMPTGVLLQVTTSGITGGNTYQLVGGGSATGSVALSSEL
jgi:hypothetical protein